MTEKGQTRLLRAMETFMAVARDVLLHDKKREGNDARVVTCLMLGTTAGFFDGAGGTSDEFFELAGEAWKAGTMSREAQLAIVAAVAPHMLPAEEPKKGPVH